MMKGAYFPFGLGENVSINRSSKTEEWNLCEVVIEKDYQTVHIFYCTNYFHIINRQFFKKEITLTGMMLFVLERISVCFTGNKH